MDALVTAGGIPTPDDPLYKYSQGKSKALADVAGKMMVQWVLDALSGSEKIDNVIIVGLNEDSGVSCEKPLYYVPNQGGMIDNIKAGTDKIVEVTPDAKQILIVSSDIPAIKAEMVDWVIDTCAETEHDMYYNLIERSVMEKRFPGSNRTFTKLKGIEICGGDMNVISIWTVVAQEGLWSSLAGVRKNVLKQIGLVGYDNLLLLLFRLATPDTLAERIGKKLGIPARAIVCPYAEVAMDIDKPHQLEVLVKDLSKSQA